jgi:hypothetical protein
MTRLSEEIREAALPSMSLDLQQSQIDLIKSYKILEVDDVKFIRQDYSIQIAIKYFQSKSLFKIIYLWLNHKWNTIKVKKTE